MDTVRILFLCTGSSRRSQMADGFAKSLKPGLIQAFFAGEGKRGLDPDAVRVMAEAGVDISESGQAGRLEPYRRVRDEIRRFVTAIPGNLPGGGRP